MELYDEIFSKIAEERMELDWRGRTTWEGDSRPAEHVERCKEYARWYISRWENAKRATLDELLQKLSEAGYGQGTLAYEIVEKYFATPTAKEDAC